MKRIRIYMMAALLLLLAASCAVTDLDRSADFYRYKTYAWGKSEVKVNDPVYSSDLINKNVRSTVENELSSRGIHKNTKNPDFLISYHTYTKEKEQTTGGMYYGYPYPFRFYRYGFGWGFPYAWSNPPRTATYTEGTLMIDVIDAHSKELVWRGVVKGNVDNIPALQKQIQKGIRAIMKKYPVKVHEPLILKDEKTIS
jgi:hypothetical protein